MILSNDEYNSLKQLYMYSVEDLSSCFTCAKEILKYWYPKENNESTLCWIICTSLFCRTGQYFVFTLINFFVLPPKWYVLSKIVRNTHIKVFGLIILKVSMISKDYHSSYTKICTPLVYEHTVILYSAKCNLTFQDWVCKSVK